MEKNINHTVKMKIDSIFFLPANQLGGVNVNNEREFKEGKYMAIEYSGTNTKSYVENTDMLLAIKYLGKGYFEEMLTGEIILSGNTILEHYYPKEKCDDFELADFEGTDEDYDSYRIIKHKDNITEWNTDLSKPTHINNLQNCLERLEKYPLRISGNILYTIEDDEFKKQYLKYTNEERIKFIKEVKEAAIKDVEIVKTIITNEIKNTKKISDEDIAMAYLENELYDFANKGKSK